MITIRDAAMTDAMRLARRLRADDALECKALGFDAHELIETSLSNSWQAWAAEEDGKVIALWGYGAQGIFGEAEAWLLTAPEVERHRKLFLKLNHDFLTGLLDLNGSVVCHVHADYRRAVKWLAWLGFQPETTIKVNGAEFIQMRLRRQ